MLEIASTKPNIKKEKEIMIRYSLKVFTMLEERFKSRFIETKEHYHLLSFYQVLLAFIY